MMCEKNRERRKRSKNACGRYLPKWKGWSNVISKSNSKSVEKLNGYPLATAMLFFFANARCHSFIFAKSPYTLRQKLYIVVKESSSLAIES